MENLSISLLGNASGKVKGICPVSFYERDTVQVAKDLLGKLLVVKSTTGITAGRIVETEAYHGSDPASHSSRGKTPRCSVMFGEPGVAYVYFIYGMYQMLNFVTEPQGYPGAVLIRACEPVCGEELMGRRRKTGSRSTLTSGPGRLSQAMGIKMSHNGQSLAGPSIFVLDDGHGPEGVFASKRVGISVGKDYAWRFFVNGNPFVSRVAENAEGFPVRE